MIKQLDPYLLKFCNKADLKGAALNSQKRPITRVLLEPTIVQSDFQNTYSIIGFCGIATHSSSWTL